MANTQQGGYFPASQPPANRSTFQFQHIPADGIPVNFQQSSIQQNPVNFQQSSIQQNPVNFQQVPVQPSVQSPIQLQSSQAQVHQNPVQSSNQFQQPAVAFQQAHRVEDIDHYAEEERALLQEAPVARTDHSGLDELREQFQILQNQLQRQQGIDLPSTKFRDLCPFPDAQVPQNFEVPKFKRYDGSGCPTAHLKAFCGELSAISGNEGALIRLFQKSLKGDALDWYTSLDCHRIRTWEQLSQAFVDRFAYNLNMAPRRADLATLG